MLPHRASNFRTTAKLAPAGVAFAAIAAVGFGFFTPTYSVRADTATGQTVEPPMGRAPLSFADLVDRVKPSVVSVSVINDGGASKVAENNKNDKNDKNDKGDKKGFTLPRSSPRSPAA